MYSVSSSLLRYQYLPLRPADQEDGEFRLLTLHLGRKGSTLVCDLMHVSIHSPPTYEALSYTWGDPKTTLCSIPNEPFGPHLDFVQISGQHLPVSPNLEAALQRMRSEVEIKTLWVDAICIDQNNDNEKSIQVSSMATIYSQASRVLCWLGDEDANTGLAFDTIEELCWLGKARFWQACSNTLGSRHPSQVTGEFAALLRTAQLEGIYHGIESYLELFRGPKPRENFQKAMDRIKIDFTEANSLIGLASLRFDASRSLIRFILTEPTTNLSNFPGFQGIVRALKDLFLGRSYWERAWIVQELRCAQEATIFCGRYEADLSFTESLAMLTDRNNLTGTSILLPNIDSEALSELDGAISVPILHRLFRYKRRTLFQELADQELRSCSEPRDIIYAPLGYCQPIDVVPDYNKPVPVVYREATLAMIQQEKHLNIICLEIEPDISEARHMTQKFDLPSWVPHFESSLTPGRLHSLDLSFGKQFYCAGGPVIDSESLQAIPNTEILRINGCFYGTIESFCAKVPPFTSPADVPGGWTSALAELQSSGPKVEPSSGCDHNITTIKAMLVAYGHSMDIFRAILLDCYVNNSGNQCRLKQNEAALHNLMTDLQTHSVSGKMPARLEKELRFAMSQKSLCTTTKGNLAQVLGDIKFGDHIFVARGATIPFILRPVTKDKSFSELQGKYGISTLYQFIGGSYVHGIMDGEVLDMIDSTSVQEESVFLV